LPYKILYEDSTVIAVNKSEGLASISENDTSIETLHSMLSRISQQKLFVVHRIDKEVSGVILFAKNSKAHKFLNDQFAQRTVRKYYTALVHGIVKEDEGVIDKPIREFGSGRMGIDEKKGKKSLTLYKVLKRFKNYTLLELNPSTGRRHQLRVHLYFINHPIVGDLRYGDYSVQKIFPRLMLHAKSIEIMKNSKEPLFVEAKEPETFCSIIEKLKLQDSGK
jgi:tRNA pseudouridine32 synthase / 23S rRNA pseudouridine746 synthase